MKKDIASKKTENINPHSQFIIDVIIGKFIGFCPIYRQVDKVNKMGVDFTKGEIINEVVYLAEKLRPIYNDFFNEIKLSKRVFWGSLPVKRFYTGKCTNKKYRYEVLISDLRNIGLTTPPCVLISLPVESGHKKNVTNLKNFHEVLQLPYGTYLSSLFDSKVMTIATPINTLLERLKCISMKESDSIGIKIMEIIDELYVIEDSLKGKLPPDRLNVRKSDSLPRISSIYGFLEDKVAGLDDLIGKKLYGKLLKHRGEYTAFCYNGFIDIDNSVYNETIKKIFPKYINGECLFFNDRRMGDAASIFFSLIGTCILNDLDPKKWLAHVVQRVYHLEEKDVVSLSPLHLRNL
jgi:hypothetical protein